MICDLVKGLHIPYLAVDLRLSGLVVLLKGNQWTDDESVRTSAPASPNEFIRFGSLVVQLPSEYSSEDAGSAWYGVQQMPLQFQPEKYALRFAASYDGVKHHFGPVRTGLQILLMYDIWAQPPWLSSPIKSCYVLHDLPGSLAPVTTQLLALLGNWLEVGDSGEYYSNPPHLIYAFDEDDGTEGPIEDALKSANEWARLTPLLLVPNELRKVGIPSDVQRNEKKRR
jgi:hypothetical protein